MGFEELKKIVKRLFKNYVRKHLGLLIISLMLSLTTAGSTAAIAWLLDPAIEKLFIEQDKRFALIIPLGVVLAFSIKGISLYFARTNVIKVGFWISSKLQKEMSNKILRSDTDTMDNKHSAKFISNFLYDTNLVQQSVSSGVLNLMKDSATLIALTFVMFYQNFKLAIFAILMIPIAAVLSKSLGKRIGKAGTESMDLAGKLSSFLSEIVKGSKIIKIYQSEDSEQQKAVTSIENYNNKLIKIASIMIRATPIMEVLTGIMIAGFIYYSGLLISKGELGINNFFSFLTAMMLAYQPVRSLATINMTIYQGAAGAKRIFAVIDEEVNIKDNFPNKELRLTKANISFDDVSFQYISTNEKAIKNISFSVDGGTMAAFVGHSGAGKSTIMNLIPKVL